jgi:hypothetical protein
VIAFQGNSETGLRKPIPVGNPVPRDPMRRRSFVKAAEPNALQAKALRAAGCRRIFEDAISP